MRRRVVFSLDRQQVHSERHAAQRESTLSVRRERAMHLRRFADKSSGREQREPPRGGDLQAQLAGIGLRRGVRSGQANESARQKGAPSSDRLNAAERDSAHVVLAVAGRDRLVHPRGDRRQHGERLASGGSIIRRISFRAMVSSKVAVRSPCAIFSARIGMMPPMRNLLNNAAASAGATPTLLAIASTSAIPAVMVKIIELPKILYAAARSPRSPKVPHLAGHLLEHRPDRVDDRLRPRHQHQAGRIRGTSAAT